MDVARQTAARAPRLAHALDISDTDAHEIWGDRGVYMGARGRAFAYAWSRRHGAFDYTPVGVTHRISARGIVPNRRTRNLACGTVRVRTVAREVARTLSTPNDLRTLDTRIIAFARMVSSCRGVA